MPDPIQWTGALVLQGLRLFFAPQPRLGEQPGSLRVLVDKTRQLLGPTSPEFVALMLRCAPVPGVSVRQRCRERVGWFRSRSQLYWWSHKGAVRVADALNRGGIAVSPELQTGPLP